tara:strand:- start:452 stop:1489 length:1038 start_codon:yes stop_codon:yes gene_type:complete
MSDLIERLSKKSLINPPKWMARNTHFLAVTGSTAYGVSDDVSDMDIIGYCIPPRDKMFPHLAGAVPGFGTQPNVFSQYQQHHIHDKEKRREYDITVYSIVKFFDLVMDNNPTLIDTLFVPDRCILHCTTVGTMVRDYRREFLHRGSWHRFRGYAFSQLRKLENKRHNIEIPNEVELAMRKIDNKDLIHLNDRSHGSLTNLSEVEFDLVCGFYNDQTKRNKDTLVNGYSTKFLYHIVRLMLECRQILEERDLDIQRDRELLKSIRRGEWSLERVRLWFEQEERNMQGVYDRSTIPNKPDENAIKELLLSCLEQHYGSIDDMVKRDTKIEDVLRDMQNVLNKYGSVA